MSKLDDQIREYADREIMRRARVTERIVRMGLVNGCESVTVAWPEDLGSTRWTFPTSRRKRLRLLRKADRIASRIREGEAR